MLLSDRTRKYVEAMIRDGDNFDYFKWLRGVREEEAREKHISAVVPSAKPVAPETGHLPNTSDRRNGCINVAPAVMTQPAPIYRLNHKARGETPEIRLRRRLMKASDAFDEFQESRVRDAVYGYLGAVFEIVEHYRLRRRTKSLLRRAFKFADLPFAKNADPFAVIIRCTCDQSADNKTISKWARALRYVANRKKPRTSLKTFIKKMGGINACAARYARYFGRGSR